MAGCRPNQVSAIIDGEIRTCLPDFSARNIILEPNLFVLGEAKTADDFLTRHEDAENQMNVMINVLKSMQNQLSCIQYQTNLLKELKTNFKKR